jgi:hypothetical protein
MIPSRPFRLRRGEIVSKVFAFCADTRAMRLLSFLTDIEKSVIAESPVVDDGAWETSRIVNFHHGLARLTLTARPGNDFPGGSIFIQAFVLADGSQSLKAVLDWETSNASSVMNVYSTPQMNWRLEASRIASTWLEGPKEVSEPVSAIHDPRPLQAVGGVKAPVFPA